MYATLAALKSAISSECARDDATFSARVPEFVTMAEARIFHGTEPLRSRAMETRATITIADGTAVLPANFLQARRFTWDTGQPYELTFRQAEEFYASPVIGSYTIDGNAIDVGGKANGQAILSYYAKPAGLVLDTDTHAVLTAHGHVYLFAALIEAYAYLRNSGKAEESALRFTSAINGANATAISAVYSGTHLAPRIPGTGARSGSRTTQAAGGEGFTNSWAGVGW